MTRTCRPKRKTLGRLVLLLLISHHQDTCTSTVLVPTRPFLSWCGRGLKRSLQAWKVFFPSVSWFGRCHLSLQTLHCDCDFTFLQSSRCSPWDSDDSCCLSLLLWLFVLCRDPWHRAVTPERSIHHCSTSVLQYLIHFSLSFLFFLSLQNTSAQWTRGSS